MSPSARSRPFGSFAGARRVALRWLVPLGAGALIVAVGLPVVAGGRDRAPGLNVGPAPWGLPDHPGARIRAAGLPAFSKKGAEAPHPHVHLDVFVNGRSIAVPARLGFEAPYSPLHTHSASGIVHIESADAGARFTLGQLATLWGVRLSDRCLGGYCAPQSPVRVYVNGRAATPPFRDLVLRPYAEIALVVGVAPGAIPRSYDCHDAAGSERVSCQGFLDTQGR